VAINISEKHTASMFRVEVSRAEKWIGNIGRIGPRKTRILRDQGLGRGD
jgi:hypothetical protein